MIAEAPFKTKHFGAQLGLKLSREMLAGLRKIANERGVPVNDVVREILAAALDSTASIRTTSDMKRIEAPRG